MSDLTFENTLKQQKAATWLFNNDAFVRGFIVESRKSPESAVLAAAMYGGEILKRLKEKTEQMTVTSEERFAELGRQHRAKMEAAQWQVILDSPIAEKI